MNRLEKSFKSLLKSNKLGKSHQKGSFIATFKEDSLLNRDVIEAKDLEKVTSMSVEQTMTELSMLSQNELQRYIKSKLGNVFQDKVDLLFEFFLIRVFSNGQILERQLPMEIE